MNKKNRIGLQLLFMILLLVECISMYNSNYTIYGYTRILAVFPLLLSVFDYRFIKTLNIAYYTIVVIVMAADILTIKFRGYEFYIGLSLFSYVYLSYAVFLYRYLPEKKHRFFPPLIYVLGIFLAIIIILFKYLTNLRDVLSMIQAAIHTFILILLFYWTMKSRQKKKKNNSYILISSVLIIVANILYAIDMNILYRKYVLVGVLVVFFHGLYLYSISQCIVLYNKANSGPLGKDNSK